MAGKFKQAFVRETMRTNAKGKKVRIGWQLVVKYKEANPDYVEKPKGEDTRTPSQKRRDTWKQLTRTSHARTKTEANRDLQDLLTELEEKATEKEKDPQPGDTLLLDFIEEYITMREAAQIIEKSTAADYRKTAVTLKRRFAGVTLAELTSTQVQKWETAELQRGVCPTTVGKAHRLLKQVLKYAVNHEYVQRNIMDVVEPPKRTKKIPNGLSIEEAQRVTAILMEAGPTPVCTAAFLALHASLRAGECCGLQWRDVDLEARQLHIRHAVGLGRGGAYLKSAKTNGSIRTVDIDEDTAKMLEARRERLHEELVCACTVTGDEKFQELYVCGTILGNYLNPQILSRKWSAIAEERHIMGTEGKRATFHTLRHGFATVAIATNQVDIASIAAQMGHSNITQTLNTYTSALASGKKKVARAIGEAMSPTNIHLAPVTQLAPTGTVG